GILVLGASEGSYKKRHLVPFGEYLPFDHALRGLINFFNIPMSTLTPGPQNQPLINIHHLLFGASICYEVAYPSLIWHQAAQANILINISDDSWFDHSIAASQQLQMSQMRALETGRPMIAVNNNGETALISPKGEITKFLPADKIGVLRGTVTGYTGATPLLKLIS
ncbi:MAG: apolipoprotein N-acyltransferase, partial [Gammaproteobacteria bacterium]|nr:apolipoprotein N-acyltransferase [Gammaproteobacteria bacterium]